MTVRATGSSIANDPQGALQVLGQMKLGEDELAQSTPTERRNLLR